ncbi:O-antigen ligase family protein [Chitinibacter sp. SCUT-21]|uniref:O-antigen ligase family protein n=1 Tax=Chitinibacter sp. SCUT-21 TaxID=2970891 RepID=UPI0035A5B3E6
MSSFKQRFRESSWVYLIAGVLFLFPALILLRAGSYNYTAGVLLIISISYCIVFRHKIGFNKEDGLFFTFIFSYPLILLIAVLVSNGRWSALDYPWRAMALIPIVLMLTQLKYDGRFQRFWIGGWIFGCVAAGSMAAYLVFWQGWLRVGSQITNEIPYGQIAAIMALGSLLFISNSKKILLRFICFLAAGFAIFSLAVSGTRGAWLGFVAGLLLCGMLAIRWNWRRFLLLALIVGLAVFYLNSLTIVQVRLEGFKNEITAYQAGNTATSLGVRADLWHLSFELAKQQPFFGVGPGNFKTAIAPKIVDKPYLTEFSHAHSQYFDTLVNSGFVGLAVLLLSFLGPLYLFVARFKRSVGWNKVFALQGCGLIVCTMVSALTQPLYAHNISVIFYLICLAVFWSFSGLKQPNEAVA